MSSSGSEGEPHHHHSIERLGEKRLFNDTSDNGRGDYPPSKKNNTSTGMKWTMCMCVWCSQTLTHAGRESGYARLFLLLCV